MTKAAGSGGYCVIMRMTTVSPLLPKIVTTVQSAGIFSVVVNLQETDPLPSDSFQLPHCISLVTFISGPEAWPFFTFTDIPPFFALSNSLRFKKLIVPEIFIGAAVLGAGVGVPVPGVGVSAPPPPVGT